MTPGTWPSADAWLRSTQRLWNRQWQLGVDGPPVWVDDHCEIPVSGDPAGDRFYQGQFVLWGGVDDDGRWLVEGFTAALENANFGCWVNGTGAPTPCSSPFPFEPG